MNKKIFVLILCVLIIFCCLILFSIYNKGNEYAVINLYKELIDETVKNNFGKEDNYISIYVNTLKDPITGDILSDNAKKEILNYCKNYTDTIYSKTVEQILSEDIGSKENLNGLVISINLLNISKKDIKLDVNCYRSNLGNSGKQYICTYKNKHWKFSDIGMSWSS